jgi:serine/threonine-protein kinase
LPTEILAGVAGGVLLLLILNATYIYHQRKKLRKMHVAVNSTFGSTTLIQTNNPRSSIANETVLSTQTQQTYVSDATVLALPGYLNIHPKDVTPVSKIASGGMGTIWLAQPNTPSLQAQIAGQYLVIKQPTMNTIQRAQFVAMFQQEVSIHAYLNSGRNIAKLIGFAMDPPAMYIKYYPLGSLQNFIRNGHSNVPYELHAVFNILDGLARGLMFMHERMIVHCDLKPGNVLLEMVSGPGVWPFLRPLLSDFGVSRIVSNTMQVKAFSRVNINAASIRYAAPECLECLRGARTLNEGPILLKMDVYAFAILIYEMACRRLPWL